MLNWETGKCIQFLIWRHYWRIGAGVCTVLCEFPKSVLLELKGRNAVFDCALLSLSYLFRWSVTGIKKCSARKRHSQVDTVFTSTLTVSFVCSVFCCNA